MVQEQKRKKGFYFSDILSKKKKIKPGFLKVHVRQEEGAEEVT